jgi:glycosyltransferase involved in cell wall biosynthesis
MIRKTILYCGVFRFLDGNPGAHYVQGVGKALKQLGFEVVYFGAEPEGTAKDTPETREFRYVSDPLPARTSGQRLRRYLMGPVTGNTTLQRIKQFDPRTVAAVFAYQMHSVALSRLQRYCAVHRIPLVANVVEWYDPTHLPWSMLFDRLDVDRRMFFMRKKLVNFIVISRLLANFFDGAKRNVVRLPPLLDTEDPKWRLPPNLPILCDRHARTLVYAGAAGKKDLLASAILGLELCNDRRFRLLVIGTSREAVRQQMGNKAAVIDRLRDQVFFPGYIPQHRDVLAAIKACDFSVILKPDSRQAHACFPSKLPESLALGVPVIANDVSDLAEHFADNKAGMLIENADPVCFASALARIAALNPQHYQEMRAAACRQAAVKFDYRAKIPDLRAFLEQAGVLP